MAWTTLDTNNLLAGEPLVEQETLAFYENVIAVAEGAAGAPRLYGKAAVPRPQQTELEVVTVSAANDVILDELHWSGDFNNQTTSSSSYQSAGIITIVLLSGTVRFSARQSSGGGVAPASQIRILKNGTVLNTFPSASGVVTRTIDASVQPGDTFEWQVRSTGSGSGTISLQAQSADEGYIRIGIPIKVSDL